MNSSIKIDIDEQLVGSNDNLCIQDHQTELRSEGKIQEMVCMEHGGVCAICLDKIVLQEIALIKECEHAYCVKCILQWATYCQNPTCPQCKHPFKSLNVHRSLDGSLNDYMFDYYPYEDEDEDEYDDDLDEVYYSSTSLRIGNRRWGDNGYVRAGRMEARPVCRSYIQDCASSSHEAKKEEEVKEKTGRRAKRTLKREAADKRAALKHQEHLVRFGRN